MIKTISITGGIGSGKSSVSACLMSHGYCVWDADLFSRQVLFMPHVEVKLKEVFGENVFLRPGELDRPYIRQQILNDISLKDKLEQILHPEIQNLLLSKLKHLESISFSGWVFYEAALIFEKNRRDFFDANVLILSSKDKRVKRLKKSRDLSDDQIESIISIQMPDSEKEKFADYIIDNNSSLESLNQETNKLIHYLNEKFSHPS